MESAGGGMKSGSSRRGIAVLNSVRGSLMRYGDVMLMSSIFVHVDVGWGWSVGTGWLPLHGGKSWFEVVGCG